MCIILWKPERIKLYDTTIDTCFINNPDGAGFTYVEDGKLHTEKGFFTVESFKEAFRPHETKPALLHFRIRTHGDYSPENCHPFEVTPNLVFAHNGTIHKVRVDKDKSDTVIFNETVVQTLVRVYGKRLMYDPLFIPMLESWIGYSRLVFLNAEGQVSIIGEKSGEWVSGCWFSNTSWKPYKPEAPINFKGQIWDNDLQCWVVKFKKKGKNHGQTYHEYKASKGHAETQRQGTDDWPKLPPPTSTKFIQTDAQRPIILNDYLRLNTNYMGGERGWLGKVMGFYTDGSVEVYFPMHKRMLRIPVMFLDPVTPNVIKNTE